MKKEIPISDFCKYGLIVNSERMENGELRFRLIDNNGSGYIRTIAGNKSYWQNGHYHKFTLETYIVQTGWIVIAILDNNELKFELLRSSDVFTVKPFIKHKVYMSKGSITHTIKHGVCKIDDWFPAKDLDLLTERISEREILDILNDKGKE